MNDVLALDRSLLLAINGWAHRSPLFDKLVILILAHPLLEGSFFCVFLWWLWFQSSGVVQDNRIGVMRAVAGLYGALIIARALQTLSPRRIRPVNDPALNLVAPFGEKIEWNPDWSSFPSDHAVIYFAIATVIWLHHRWLGAVAYVWVLVFACLPRIYVGYHYPADIIAGALVGICTVEFAHGVPLPTGIMRGG